MPSLPDPPDNSHHHTNNSGAMVPIRLLLHPDLVVLVRVSTRLISTVIVDLVVDPVAMLAAAMDTIKAQ